MTAEITSDFQLPPWGPFRLIPQAPQPWAVVRLEGGDITITNFVMPTLWHTIHVTPKTKGAKARSEKVYTFPGSVTGGGKGEPWWTTYRYQLEAFVDRLRGREPQIWISGEDSVAQMAAVERIYEKVRVVGFRLINRGNLIHRTFHS